MAFWRLPFALGLGLALACSPEVPTTSPSLELTDPGERLAAVNAHVFGSFRVAAGGGGSGVITSGPANFPGNPPAGPGTCVNGKWYNAQSKGTSGTLTKPHPHCIRASAAIEVVLEPISSCVTRVPLFGGCGEAEPPAEEAGQPITRTLSLGSKKQVQGTTFTNIKDGTQTFGSSASGIVTAYAIDAATLGTTNHRVGTLTFDLAQYSMLTINLFDFDASDGCQLDATILAPCLNKVITATYNPLPAPEGLGPPDFIVEGFLWMTPANSPFNYLD